MRAVNGVHLAFQAGTEDFDHPSPLQFYLGVGKSGLIRLLWEQGVQGSNPCTRTKLWGCGANGNTCALQA